MRPTDDRYGVITYVSGTNTIKFAWNKKPFSQQDFKLFIISFEKIRVLNEGVGSATEKWWDISQQNLAGLVSGELES